MLVVLLCRFPVSTGIHEQPWAVMAEIRKGNATDQQTSDSTYDIYVAQRKSQVQQVMKENRKLQQLLKISNADRITLTTSVVST